MPSMICEAYIKIPCARRTGTRAFTWRACQNLAQYISQPVPRRSLTRYLCFYHALTDRHKCRRIP
jgi:hypothetical protein